MEVDRYDPIEIENKWRDRWEKQKTFKVSVKEAKKPFYNLMMFPYPSGEGLHVGHVFTFGGIDTFGRLKKMQANDVFEPMGFDSFGIHSENYSISQDTHPKQMTDKTTAYFREKQLKKLGALFDWDHQVITSDVDYYRWTQWLFVQLFKSGLAVRKKAPVDWCPSCKTVLADEQVISGKCERCGRKVIQKELEQWFFKITDYADKLLKNLDKIDWSETTKLMQKNWIGKKFGTEINFRIKGYNEKIKVFTTRADTLYGATFLVLAPEHPIVAGLLSSKFKIQNSKIKEVKEYVKKTENKSEVEREKEKTGVFTGLYVINPLNQEEIPVWIADYALLGYGTGALFGDAHDERDVEFAKKYKMPLKPTIKTGNNERDKRVMSLEEVFTGEGTLVDSGEFSGQTSKEAIINVSKYIEDNHLGRKTINYHLRDWLISRQRYWGPPIPMIFCGNCGKRGKSWFDTEESKKSKIKNLRSKNDDLGKGMVGWYPVPEEDLPVKLPHLEDYQPKGKGVSPLGTLPDFVNVKCPDCGKDARRETDVSDAFLDSSWYFLRYPSVALPSANKEAFNREMTKKWLPVHSYIGGNEHATMHLLYTRFITMALKDMGLIDFEEPFKKFRAHGLIIKGGHKMSKSRGNVVNPNEFMDTYGVDTLRMYLLFIGPFELGGDFSERAITGVYKFLGRVWQNVLEISNSPATIAKENVAKQINKLIKRVEQDVEGLRFNTAIAALMEFLNFMVKHKKEIDQETLKKYLLVLSIFAPFTAEELWSRVGEGDSVHKQAWPKIEEKYLVEAEVTVAVQINGKLRDTVIIKNAGLKMKNLVQKKAEESSKVKRHLAGKKPKEVIYVPGKIINFVISD